MRLIFDENSRLNGLAKKMKRGDQKTAGAMFNLLAPRVFGFCLTRLGNREEAEDLTQDIFLRLLKKIELFSPEKGNFSVWFWSLARNILTDHFRKNRTQTFSVLGEDKIESLTGQKEEPEFLEKKLKIEHVYKFISSLGAEERDLFELRYAAELSYGEMSKILNKSEGALRVAAARLKQKIKNELKNV